jgi:NTE family protein
MEVMRRIVVFAGFLVISQLAVAQKVGLVLSGGGAKGIAHVGVIKALEENNIPIDYLAGTSMGGVVASCYASGWSAKQIEEVFLSEDFQRWINGKLERRHNYYYSKDDITPAFVTLDLSLDSTFNFNFSSSIANDVSLNFALAERFTVPSTIAGNNFDSLFVPLRMVASDIFTQNAVILKNGKLSDAARATHTVPFFYEPIRIDGKYLFDGGVYNNFPVDVMQKDFNPDAIIGVNVSSKIYDEYPFGEDEKLISRSLLYMLLDKSDPGIVPSTGVYIQPNLGGYSGVNFAQARSLIDSGYAQTIRQMPEIKRKVNARRDSIQLDNSRKEFLSQADPFTIDRVKFNGFRKSQRLYLARFFYTKKGPISIQKVKSAYYNLVSDDYFKNVYPSFTKDSTSKHFQFELTRRPTKNLKLDFGGVISNRNISSMFLGVNYFYFNRALTHTTLNFNVGNFYKSAQIKTRIDIPFLGRFYLEPEALYNQWNYLDNRDWFTGDVDPTILTRRDRKVGAALGFPFSKQLRFSVYSYYINNTDRYSNRNVLVSTDTLDVMNLSGYKTGWLLETNNLNRKQYATAGKHMYAKFDWLTVTEKYNPGSTSIIDAPLQEHVGWVRLKLSAEQYWKTKVYSTGYFVEGVFSNQPTFTNYFGTLINAPAFNPMPDSRTLLIQNFRAFNYLAGGLRNIFSLKPNLDLRFEGYVFKPFESILLGANQETRLSRDITRMSVGGMAALVMHTQVGPVSLSVNYYDDKESQFGILAHIGYLLFQKPSTE